MPTTYGKNKLLNAYAIDQISAHSSYPGLTGANELSGGGYARVVPTVGAASGGVRVMGTVNITVGAGSTVRWLGAWEAGNFVDLSPNGGSPKEFMADPAADTIICPSHGYSAGQTIVFYTSTPPAPLTAGTVYYVVNPTTNTFQVAATLGGSAINVTDYGNTDCQVSVIYEDVYASASTHTLSSGTFALPF